MAKNSVLKPKDCACFNIRKTARVLTQEYDHAIVSSGLKTTQFTALAVLDELGSMSITELAEAMEIERTSLTRNLAVLQRDGLVTVLHGRDARTRVVDLTPAGKRKFDESILLWNIAQARLVDRFGRKRYDSLRKELEDLRVAVRSAG